MTHSTQPQLIKQLAPSLRLVQYNQIPAISLQHQVGTACISLQGAQLLHWQPKAAKHDVLWLSEIEPFQLGHAIRGGIPICYPWFGAVKSPSHGTARLRLWHLSDYQIDEKNVKLVLSLFDENHLIEATLTILFNEQCELIFKHYGEEPAQVAFHSYFNIGDIQQIEVQGLPTLCTNNRSKEQENVSSPRQIQAYVDCTYQLTQPQNTILDPVRQRRIEIDHRDATEAVLWNPWHNPTSDMTEAGYQTMVCLESARLSRPLQQGEEMSICLSVK
ncbi:D-hexose-6-phosphate mutarotase [Pasteurella sp. PK-2025]|uniref:D-hexose-6-phosphate mutarotase n=1 Tax=Pasteurella sp. PK-2025 TaxID=3413133 RepID=UPI003C763A9E